MKKLIFLSVLIATGIVSTAVPVIPCNVLPKDLKLREILNTTVGMGCNGTVIIPFSVKNAGIVYGKLSIKGDPLIIYVIDDETKAKISGTPSSNMTFVLDANSYAVVRGEPCHIIESEYGAFNLSFRAPKGGEYYLVVIAEGNNVRSNLTVQLYWCSEKNFISICDLILN